MSPLKRRSFLKNSILAGVGLSIAKMVQALPQTGKSAYLKITCSDQFPAFEFFSVDSLGKNKLAKNISLANDQPKTTSFRVTQKTPGASYHLVSQAENDKPVWEVNGLDKSFTLVSNYHTGFTDPFLINIDQYANHATLLGIMQGPDHEVSFPTILHCPDMGTFRVSCSDPSVKILYSSKRFIEHPYVKMEFPPATAAQARISYSFEVVSIHPKVQGIDHDSRYDCFRKNFISIFQLNPFLKILANNSSSDACGFTLFKYSEVALHTPPLAEGLHAMDLVKMTLDRYLNGTKGYGMLGYDYDKTWDIPETDTTCNSLDTYPSLLISACNYVIKTGDDKWLTGNSGRLQGWIDHMLNTDRDQDGLIEFCLSGNTGSWKGDPSMRPANWWDTIGFGHKDAYSNALAFRALILLSEMNLKFGDHEKASIYSTQAAKLKDVYTKTFYNDDTGILAGWKSADGKLHDYWFTFVNAIAICYDLVEPALANQIMDRILAKMKDVGYTDFGLGLPGNLIPVIRKDYTDLKPEVGGGKREDNLDGFQIYENGGATACYTYFTIKALQKLGREKDADAILLPLLQSMSEGNFQGRCSNGRTKDWKTWTGECWGYEGFLVDNYMFLLCVLPKS